MHVFCLTIIWVLITQGPSFRSVNDDNSMMTLIWYHINVIWDFNLSNVFLHIYGIHQHCGTLKKLQEYVLSYDLILRVGFLFCCFFRFLSSTVQLTCVICAIIWFVLRLFLRFFSLSGFSPQQCDWPVFGQLFPFLLSWLPLLDQPYFLPFRYCF